MERRYSWLAIAGAAVFSIVVGMVAYNAGLSHGLAAGSGAGAVPPGGVPYGWHRPWGFFPFGPFLFLFFWLFVFRMFAWRGYHGPWRDRGGPFETESQLDEWHRRAHEQMNAQ
jgi:hypothetical protein